MDVEGLKNVQRFVKRQLAAAPLSDNLDGGPGSGNFGHAGRPGKRGGSASGGGAAYSYAGVDLNDPGNKYLLKKLPVKDGVKSLEDAVKEARAKNAGGTLSNEDFIAVGESLANDYAIRHNRIVDELEETETRMNKEINELEARQNELFMAMITIPPEERPKHGFGTEEEMNAEMDSISERLGKIMESPEYKADLQKVEQLTDALADPVENAAALADSLRKVRKVGLDGVTADEVLFGMPQDKDVVDSVANALDYYPTSWINASKNSGNVVVRPLSEDRGLYNADNNSIDSDGTLETGIHELAHRFEKVYSEVKIAEREFYEKRTQGEPLTQITGARPGEMCRKDNFIYEYMGKDYGGSFYELASMGFEMAYTDPARLAQDPEMQCWIYGMLALL